MKVMTWTNGEKILIWALVLIGIDYAGIFFYVTFITSIETVFRVGSGVIKLSRESYIIVSRAVTRQPLEPCCVSRWICENISNTNLQVNENWKSIKSFWIKQTIGLERLLRCCNLQVMGNDVVRVWHNPDDSAEIQGLIICQKHWHLHFHLCTSGKDNTTESTSI